MMAHHPIEEYISHTKSFLAILSKEPDLLITHDSKLDFFRIFLDNMSSISCPQPQYYGNNDDGCDDEDVGGGGTGTASMEKTTVEREEEDISLDNNMMSNDNNENTNKSYWVNDSNSYSYSIPSEVTTEEITEPKLKHHYDYDVIVIGSGAAGLGVSISLLHGGIRKSNLLVLEQHRIGHSFESWNYSTNFISPSFYSNPYGPIDLNSIDPFSSPSAICTGGSKDYLSGKDYAYYLRVVASDWSIPIREGVKVTSITKMKNNDAKEGFDIICCKDNGDTVTNVKYFARFVVWCGGEWCYPSATTPTSIPKYISNGILKRKTCIHYSEIGTNKQDWCQFASQATNNKTPIIIIGAFEAGVDAACTLIHLDSDAHKQQKHRVIIVEKEMEFNNNNNASDEVVVDPSISLSASSKRRLQCALQTGRLEILYGWTYRHSSIISSEDSHTTYQASLVKETNNNEESKQIVSTAPILLCNGFDPSRGLIKDLLHWNYSSDNDKAKEESIKYGCPVAHNGPIVSQSCDESLLCPGVFLCGPMLRHTITRPNNNDITAAVQDNKCIVALHNYIHSHNNKEDNNTSTKENTLNNTTTTQVLIFCFIYKFRTRFALVSGEILSRLVYEDHCREQAVINNSNDDDVKNADEEQQVYIDSIGNERLEKIENMLSLYKEKGMYIADLNSCSISSNCFSPC